MGHVILTQACQCSGEGSIGPVISQASTQQRGRGKEAGDRIQEPLCHVEVFEVFTIMLSLHMSKVRNTVEGKSKFHVNLIKLHLSVYGPSFTVNDNANAMQCIVAEEA